jgi:hypothetical protein
MSGSPPLRFLAVVLGGWAALRTILIAPPWPAATVSEIAAAVPGRAVAATLPDSGAEPVKAARVLTGTRHVATAVAVAVAAGPTGRSGASTAITPSVQAPEPRLRMAEAEAEPAPPFLTSGLLPARPGAAAAVSKRWSISAWSFVRRGDSRALAAGGLLGGSQAGARFSYRLNRDEAHPLALSLRLSAPLRRTAGAEGALGLDWKPARGLPVHLLAERRQALGREGRSAFAVTLYGGVSDAPLGPFRIDGYAQAGIVGTRSRDPFADGSLRASLPLTGRVRLGGGAWAAAQPGLARLDVGPQAALRLPFAGRAVTLAADWRLRVAGDAEPGSGPTVTLATDF